MQKLFTALMEIAGRAGRISEDIREAQIICAMCDALEEEAENLKREYPFIAIVEGLKNIKAMTERVERLYKTRSEFARDRIFFVLLPMISEVMYDAYFFTQVFGNPEAEKKHYESEFFELRKNPLEQSKLLSIVVLAYNKLDYTKKCVESILKYTPDMDYELILINNGSSDGTAEYFDSFGVTKTIHLQENSLSNMRLYSRITEGRYILSVNNDVVVTEGYLDNLLMCMQSDDRIGMCVPTTPNISNNQGIAYAYTDDDAMQEFARKHNVSDPTLWEDRLRLCNPISLMRADAVQAVGEHDNYFPFGEFSDDALSHRLHTGGYRLVLCKDTYCHHYGSITLRDAQVNHNTLGISRGLFKRRYGFDAWDAEHLKKCAYPLS